MTMSFFLSYYNFYGFFGFNESIFAYLMQCRSDYRFFITFPIRFNTRPPKSLCCPGSGSCKQQHGKIRKHAKGFDHISRHQKLAIL